MTDDFEHNICDKRVFLRQYKNFPKTCGISLNRRNKNITYISDKNSI